MIAAATPDDDRNRKIEYVLAQQELQRRALAAPLLHYVPHEGQIRAHTACSTPGIRITIIHSGNRFGKTTLLGAEIVAALYGYRPWLVPGLRLQADGDYPPREAVAKEYWVMRANDLPLMRPSRNLVVSGLPGRQGILGAVWPEIERFLPPAIRRHPDFKLQRGAYSVPLYLKMPSASSARGAEIQFCSGDMDPMAFAGQNFSRIFADEPFKKVFWGEIWRGATDQLASLIMTATPIGANAPWIFDELIASGRTDILAIAGSIHENPHVTDEAKHEFLEGGNFTEEERQAREHGAWSFLTHRAFPMFDPHVHVIPPFHIPPGWIRGMAVDPAHRRPFAIAWAAFGPHGEMIIYDEYPNVEHHKLRTSLYTVPDYIKVIRGKELNTAIDFRCVDPRFGPAGPRIKGEVHTSIQEDFARGGLYLDARIEGTEREETGIERLRQGLRWDRKAPLSPTNRPKIRIFDHCKNTINAFAMSNFQPPGSRDPDVLPEKLAEKFKDFRDVVRYLELYPKVPRYREDELSYISEADLEAENDPDDWF